MLLAVGNEHFHRSGFDFIGQGRVGCAQFSRCPCAPDTDPWRALLTHRAPPSGFWNGDRAVGVWVHLETN
jgi:hypothetical protein